MQDLKPQRAVESDSSLHFVGAQCDRADSLNHGQNSPVSFPRAVCSRHFSTGQNNVECATYRLAAASWIDWIRNIRNGQSRFMGPELRCYHSWNGYLCSRFRQPVTRNRLLQTTRTRMQTVRVW